MKNLFNFLAAFTATLFLGSWLYATPYPSGVGGVHPITVSDLEIGTDGELITWDASGDPTVVAVGTADEVLTSNGTGAAPSFKAATGGAWQLISTVAADNDTSIDISSGIDSTFKLYKIVVNNFRPATDAQNILMRVDVGSGFETGASYRYAKVQVISTGNTVLGDASSGATSMILNIDNLSNTAIEVHSGIVYFHDPSFTAARTKFTWHFNFGNGTSSAVIANTTGTGMFNSSVAIVGIQFIMSSGNITTGDFTLYGLVKS